MALREPDEWSDFVAELRVVDEQAPGPHLPWKKEWLLAGTRKDLTARAFTKWRAEQIRRELQKRPRWRRTLARLIEDTGGGPDDEERDEKAQWEKEQDAAAYLSWADRLPLHRNVPHPLSKSAILHVVAGLVDEPDRQMRSLDESAVHLEGWARNAMILDPAWLRSTFRLSKGEAIAMSLFLRGWPRRAIVSYRGVGDEGIKEQLARAHRKIRGAFGSLSPDAAPLHMKEAIGFERE